MSTDEDGDKLKLFWDLFFKAETGTYEVRLYLLNFCALFVYMKLFCKICSTYYFYFNLFIHGKKIQNIFMYLIGSWVLILLNLQKSTWLDLFLAEFLIRLNEGGDPKELIKFW